MALIQDKDRKVVQDRLKDMVSPVRLILFTQEMECQFCRETRQLMTELSELSDTLTLDVYNFQIDAEQVNRYGIDKVPAVVVEGSNDYGVRYYGIPGGYEFGSLLETIQAVSRGDSGLAPESKAKLALLQEPVHMQVFVTPTWPYCAPAVVTAHRMAIESKLIRADMVEASEFPHLAIKYNVRGVPRTVVNETGYIEGALPEGAFIEAVMKAAQQSPPETQS